MILISFSLTAHLFRIYHYYCRAYCTIIVQFSMAIKMVKLMLECCPQNLCIETIRMKRHKQTNKSKQRRKQMERNILNYKVNNPMLNPVPKVKHIKTKL